MLGAGIAPPLAPAGGELSLLETLAVVGALIVIGVLFAWIMIRFSRPKAKPTTTVHEFEDRRAA